jgi:hypothetical protein
MRPLVCFSAALLAALSLPAQAISENQFMVHNTQDIIDVCTAPTTDPLYTAAINFCHGYLVGAYHYQEALYSGPDVKPVVCPPDPPPTHSEGVAKYIEWAKAHPQYANDRAVDSLSRFLAETWPCKN